MSKYYRVLKDTFMWKEGAIISNGDDSSGYVPIEDIWNVFEDQTEYISHSIIENNSEWFERVYRDNLKGNVFRSADKLKEIYKKKFK